MQNRPSRGAQPSPTPDSSTRSTASDKPAEPEPQLLPRLLARIGSGPDQVPPDRGIFREYLDLKIGTALVYVVPHRGEGTRRQQRGDPRRIRASTVHHVCWIIYGRANAAGIIQNFTEQAIAVDSHGLAPRTVADALAVIEGELHIVGRTRRGRRSRAVYALALGTLTWPEVVRRARRERHAGAQTALDFGGSAMHQARLPEPPSDDEPSSLSDDEPSSPRGLRTEGEVRTAAATGHLRRGDRNAVDGRSTQQQQHDDDNHGTTTTTNPPDAGRTDAGDGSGTRTCHDQEREHNRLEGLIAAVAARSRELREPFDENRAREAFTAGELTFGDLQARADELAAAIDAAGERAPARRRRGRGRDRPDLTDEEQRVYEASGGNPWAVQRYREEHDA